MNGAGPLAATRDWFAHHGLVRPGRGRWLAGVCAGLAHWLDTSPLLVRALFVISTFIPGPQFLVYIALWIMMPRDPRA